MNLENWRKILTCKVKGIMLFTKVANCFDFLGFREFKRLAEYFNNCSFKDARKIERFTINHLNHIITPNSVVDPLPIIENWSEISRLDVKNDSRLKYLKEIFTKMHDFKKYEIEEIEKAMYDFSEKKDFVSFDEASCILEKSTKDLKCIERKLIMLEKAGWDLKAILTFEKETHDYFKNKAKKGVYTK